MNFPKNVLAKRLYALRKYFKFTQKAISKMAGIEKESTYRAYEKGTNMPHIDTMLSICNVYRITPNSLLDCIDHARVAIICDKYGIDYKETDSEHVEIVIKHKDKADSIHPGIPKPIFYEVLFNAEKSVNHIALPSKMQKLKERLNAYESETFFGLFESGIYFSNQTEEMLRNLNQAYIALSKIKKEDL